MAAVPWCTSLPCTLDLRLTSQRVTLPLAGYELAWGSVRLVYSCVCPQAQGCAGRGSPTADGLGRPAPHGCGHVGSPAGLPGPRAPAGPACRTPRGDTRGRVARHRHVTWSLASRLCGPSHGDPLSSPLPLAPCPPGDRQEEFSLPGLRPRWLGRGDRAPSSRYSSRQWVRNEAERGLNENCPLNGLNLKHLFSINSKQPLHGAKSCLCPPAAGTR